MIDTHKKWFLVKSVEGYISGQHSKFEGNYGGEGGKYFIFKKARVK